MSLIMINGNQVNLKEQPSIKAADGNASQSNYILVWTSERLMPPQMDALANKGVIIHEYVSKHTCRCGYERTNLAMIQGLPYVA